MDKGEISDGYHTFNELYEHRHTLFRAVLHAHQDRAWKSLLHDDLTMFEGWFIAGIETPDGQATYHLPLRLYDSFEVKQLPTAPKWDGHTADDVIKRIAALKQSPTEKMGEVDVEGFKKQAVAIAADVFNGHRTEREGINMLLDHIYKFVAIKAV